MSFGKLYTRELNPRSTAIRAVAKANNLDLECVHIDSAQQEGPEYRKLNPQGKLPTFVGADGYVLTECIPIALYVTSQNEKTSLLGATRKDYYSILRWMSYANMEFLPCVGGCVLPLIGLRPYDKEIVKTNVIALQRNLRVLEDRLSTSAFLVDDSLTLADVFIVSFVAGGFQVFHKAWRVDFPATTKWFEKVYHLPMYDGVAHKLILLDVPFPVFPLEEETPQKKRNGVTPSATTLPA